MPVQLPNSSVPGHLSRCCDYVSYYYTPDTPFDVADDLREDAQGQDLVTGPRKTGGKQTGDLVENIVSGDAGFSSSGVVALHGSSTTQACKCQGRETGQR